MHDIAASDASPSVTRVSDSNETAFSFATSKQTSWLASLSCVLFSVMIGLMMIW